MAEAIDLDRAPMSIVIPFPDSDEIWTHPPVPQWGQTVVMDFALNVFYPSVFGYLLGRNLSPAKTHARHSFMHNFACLVALPHRYQEAIDSWNVSHSDWPFQPISGPSCTLTRMGPDLGCAINMTINEVIQVLIDNCIPVPWIDHWYVYSLYYLDHHHDGQSLFMGYLKTSTMTASNTSRPLVFPPSSPNGMVGGHPLMMTLFGYMLFTCVKKRTIVTARMIAMTGSK
jgi:hypothetical protein